MIFVFIEEETSIGFVFKIAIGFFNPTIAIRSVSHEIFIGEANGFNVFIFQSLTIHGGIDF